MTDVRPEQSLIAEGDILKVREATSLVQLFEEITAVKRSGSRYTALCPFHDENTPSLSIDEDLGLYHCFGCQASGDAITFLRETQSLGLRAAVEYLADRAGITLTYEESAEAFANRVKFRKLHGAIEQSIEYYQDQLFNSPEAEDARKYLGDRGWSEELIRQFKVGWAPKNGNGAVRSLRIPSDIAYESGIALKGDGGRPYDLLRGRIVFPIFEPGGKPVAIAGRVMPGDPSSSKYVNSPEGPLYKKRRILYGLNWAKKGIATSDEVIVCEGYTDVVAFYRAGLTNAVATCGVALTEEHIKLLRRFAKKIIVAYDADTAGAEGVQRLYRWESTHGIEIAVVSLDSGEDPASLVEQGHAEDLVAAVNGAKPLLGWRVDRLLASSDLATPEARLLAAEEAMTLVNVHPKQILRDLYAEVIADTCGIDRSLLKPKKVSNRPAPPATRSVFGKSKGPEYEALRVAVHRPEEVADWLMPQLFSEDLALRVYYLLISVERLSDVTGSTDVEAVALISQMEFEDSVADARELRTRLVVEATKRVCSVVMHDHSGDVNENLKLVGDLCSAMEKAKDNDDAAVEELLEWLGQQPAGEPPVIEFAAQELLQGVNGSASLKEVTPTDDGAVIPGHAPSLDDEYVNSFDDKGLEVDEQMPGSPDDWL